MNPDDFRRHGHALVDWIANYFEQVERYPILPRVEPGEITASLPDAAPERGEPFEAIMADVERLLVPGLTHWNHPGFLAYFDSCGSPPGVLGELLCAALNQQAMLWRTSPAATELEAVTLGWLRKLIGLPEAFEGVIYDTASISTMHALLAARELAVRDVRLRGLAGRDDLPRVRVYCSEQTHSSIDKSVIAIGLGQQSLAKIPVDAEYRMDATALSDAIAADRAAGVLPIAAVATVGTTSTTSVDPVPAIADICAREQLWLHVDAAYGGVAAMLPSHAHILAGADRADSIVINPHKWLFTPVDLSALYCRRMDALRAAFALTPEFILSGDEAAAARRNLMNTGIPLGRRFRSLKLWMILRSYGAEAIRERLAGHIRLAQLFASWVDAHPDFERLAPVPFSVVCFRWHPADRALAHLDAVNQQLLDLVNQSGDVFLSHTRVREGVALRLAVGHLNTEERHIRRAWDLLVDRAATLR
ncbi:MAG TPA: pyridoxal-dependent decarboxylase [Vicinamibacterales bacterium]|nr:pyridoxal-dependent decarboxylase [Vicinamibacterales bacterium]